MSTQRTPSSPTGDSGSPVRGADETATGSPKARLPRPHPMAFVSVARRQLGQLATTLARPADGLTHEDVWQAQRLAAQLQEQLAALAPVVPPPPPYLWADTTGVVPLAPPPPAQHHRPGMASDGGAHPGQAAAASAPSEDASGPPFLQRPRPATASSSLRAQQRPWMPPHRCYICDVNCTSDAQLQHHLRGKPHTRRATEDLALLRRAQAEVAAGPNHGGSGRGRGGPHRYPPMPGLPYGGFRGKGRGPQ